MSSAWRRLNRELVGLGKVYQIQLSSGDDNILKWDLTLVGPTGSSWSGLSITLKLEFPGDYPYHPPTIKFAQDIFHPNVDPNGAICQGFLDRWLPSMGVDFVINHVLQLLIEPNLDSPLNAEAFVAWQDRESFVEILKERMGK